MSFQKNLKRYKLIRLYTNKKIQTKRDFKEEASAVVKLIVEDQSKFFENFNTFLNKKPAKTETFKYYDQYCHIW